MRWFSSSRWAGLCLVLCVGAQAQTFSRAPSAEEQCLTPGPAERGTPVYPEKKLARRDGATVRVEMSFGGPDAPPRVTPLAGTEKDEFLDAVREYAERFRLPCMKADGPRVRIPMDFVFTVGSGQKVTFRTKETPEALARRRTLTACLRVPSTKDVVTYPNFALRQDLQGVVIFELTFKDPAAPPSLKVLHDGGSVFFVRALNKFVDQMRLPCLPSGEEFGSRFEFKFTMTGGDRAWLKDVDLLNFLARVKGIDQQKVFFDFNTMACPFAVNFTLRQPYVANRVGEIGEMQESRGAFVAWLEQLDLSIPDSQRELVMLHDSTITVPCIKLDL